MRISETLSYDRNSCLLHAEHMTSVNVQKMSEVLQNRCGRAASIEISNEGREYYRNSIQQNGQETYDDVLRRREQLKNEKISIIDYGYEISKKAAEWNKEAANARRNVVSTTDRANGYVAAYAELYDEIIQGYEAGTREIYVADENGTHKLTRDEELSALDAAYKKTVDDFVTMKKTNQHAREIISEEMDKISKITSRSTLAATYIEEQKTREEDEISENLGEKMYDAIYSFKEKYAMFHSNNASFVNKSWYSVM